MARPEEITEILKKLAELCRQVTDWASSENLSYRMLKDDVTAFAQKKLDMEKEVEEMKKYIDGLKVQSAGILEKATAEAENISRIARERLAEVHKKEALATETLEKANQAKYLAEKKLDEVIENYEKKDKVASKNGK